MSAIDVQNINSKTGSSAITIADSGDISLSASITFDTDTLYVDAANNRVGIGTTSPAFGLSVESDNGSGYAALFRASSSDPALTIQTTGGITQIQGLNSALSATNSVAMQTSGGNVGIGTTSPQRTFHVSSGATNVVARLESTDATSVVEFKDDTGTAEVGCTGNNLVLSPAGIERMRVDSSGNVGIGTTSPSAKLHAAGNIHVGVEDNSNHSSRLKIINGGSAGYEASLDFCYEDKDTVRARINTDGSGGRIEFHTFDGSLTERMRIAADGNVGIGTASPTNPLTIQASSGAGAIAVNGRSSDGIGTLSFYASNGTTGQGYIQGRSDHIRMWAPTSNFLTLGTNDAERVRIDSSGNFLVGTTTTVGSTKMVVENTVNGNYVSSFRHTNTSPYGIHVFYSNATPPNNTSNRFIDCEDTVGQKFQVRSNGGIANFQANDANLSDSRTKKDIVASGSYLEKLCNIPVRNFRYNEDAEDSKHHLGVIAQEVEAVAPEFVSKASWEHKDGPMDTVYNTDLMFAMMKSIQELSAQVTELKAEVAALKGSA